MNIKKSKICLSDNKIIAGVCGGLAEYFGIDPVIVRLIVALLILNGFAVIPVYLIMWFIMPKKENV